MKKIHLAFDHLVHVVQSPSQAVNTMKNYGFHAVEGGQHKKWGTYNALCYFDLSYIEFLGIDNQEVANKVLDNDVASQASIEIRKGEGPIRIALRTNDMQKVVSQMKRQGFSIKGPFKGSRTSSGGVVSNWSMLFPQEINGDYLPLPFIIQWDQKDSARRSDLIKNHFIDKHPLGELQISYIAFAVKDLKRTVSIWSTLLDLKPYTNWIDQELAAECISIPLPGGDLVFCSPTGDGLVSETIELRGERPFLVNISGCRRKENLFLFGSTYQLS